MLGGPIISFIKKRGGVVMGDEVLTIQEVAVLLKMATKTVYSMAQRGELPAFKVRGQWRVRKVDFDKWIAGQARAATTSATKKAR